MKRLNCFRTVAGAVVVGCVLLAVANSTSGADGIRYSWQGTLEPRDVNDDPWEIGAVRVRTHQEGQATVRRVPRRDRPHRADVPRLSAQARTGPGDHWMVVVAFSCGHHMDDEREDAVAERLVLYADGIVSQ